MLLTITKKLRMILQNILRRVVDNVPTNIAPSNNFLIMLLHAKFHHKFQAAFGHCEFY